MYHLEAKCCIQIDNQLIISWGYFKNLFHWAVLENIKRGTVVKTVQHPPLIKSFKRGPRRKTMLITDSAVSSFALSGIMYGISEEYRVYDGRLLYELTGMIRTTGRYGCIMERLCLTENIACLLYIVYNIIYNNILVCKCTICIILCFGLSSSEYHFVSQKSDEMIKNQKLISNQNNSEYEMSDSDRSF